MQSRLDGRVQVGSLTQPHQLQNNPPGASHNRSRHPTAMFRLQRPRKSQPCFKIRPGKSHRLPPGHKPDRVSQSVRHPVSQSYKQPDSLPSSLLPITNLRDCLPAPQQARHNIALQHHPIHSARAKYLPPYALHQANPSQSYKLPFVAR